MFHISADVSPEVTLYIHTSSLIHNILPNDNRFLPDEEASSGHCYPSVVSHVNIQTTRKHNIRT